MTSFTDNFNQSETDKNNADKLRENFQLIIINRLREDIKESAGTMHRTILMLTNFLGYKQNMLAITPMSVYLSHYVNCTTMKITETVHPRTVAIFSTERNLIIFNKTIVE